MAKKLFILSGVNGDYNALTVALNGANFDANNPDHILISAGDYFGKVRSCMDCLYFWRSLKTDRKIFLQGKNEKMLLDLFNIQTTPWNVMEQYIVQDELLVLLNTIGQGTGNEYSPDIMQQVAHYVERMFKEECGFNIKEMIKETPLFLETKQYVISYGDLSGMTGEEATFENIISNAKQKTINNRDFFMDKSSIVGYNKCKDVLKSYIDFQTPNQKVPYLVRGDQKDGNDIILLQNPNMRMKLSSNPSAMPPFLKAYINTDTVNSHRVNILVLEDELIEKDKQPQEELKAEEPTLATSGYCMDDVGVRFDELAQAMGVTFRNDTTTTEVRAGMGQAATWTTTTTRVAQDGDIFINGDLHF